MTHSNTQSAKDNRIAVVLDEEDIENIDSITRKAQAITELFRDSEFKVMRMTLTLLIKICLELLDQDIDRNRDDREYYNAIQTVFENIRNGKFTTSEEECDEVVH